MNHDLHRGTPSAGAGRDGASAAPGDAAISYRGLTIEPGEASELSTAELVRKLVDAGASRLTAERIVEIERGADEAGRARRHVRGR